VDALLQVLQLLMLLRICGPNRCCCQLPDTVVRERFCQLSNGCSSCCAAVPVGTVQ
jgi:hypothetical protein